MGGCQSSHAAATLSANDAAPVKVLVTMDPGQDLDDEIFMVLSAALTSRHLCEIVGIVTCLAPATMRARLARGTMDQLGMYDVHIAAGTDGGGSGDASSIAKMAAVDYLTRLPPQEEAGHDLMRNALSEAEDKSVTIAVIASLKDVANLLAKEEALFFQKVKEVVIMGGVLPFTPGEAPMGEFLMPDSAHNNEFDSEASAFVYRRLQEIGTPLVVVSRFAAYACQLPKKLYDRMGETGSRIGKHLQWAQRQSIETLWQRACAPEGSETRHGLPMRCDKKWFLQTFCHASLEAGEVRGANDAIWDLIEGFNMYDPLALCVAVPSLSEMFVPCEYTVNGITHRVYGVSKEENGVRDANALREWLLDAFMQGIRQSEAISESAATKEVRALRAEVKKLRAQLEAANAQIDKVSQISATVVV